MKIEITQVVKDVLNDKSGKEKITKEERNKIMDLINRIEMGEIKVLRKFIYGNVEDRFLHFEIPKNINYPLSDEQELERAGIKQPYNIEYELNNLKRNTEIFEYKLINQSLRELSTDYNLKLCYLRKSMENLGMPPEFDFTPRYIVMGGIIIYNGSIRKKLKEEKE